MASKFEKPITIKDVIDKIDNGSYLIPAIQRKFVWSNEQIERLFDSIMRGYPINSFMFWEVTDNKVKTKFKFYKMLNKYREWFAENNIDIDTKGYKNFQAIIDGQQRLTSLYIGIKGTYAYKLERKWYRDDEDSIPTRRLYLEITKPLQDDNELQMKYNFKFLTKEEVVEKNKKENWFRVNNILKYEDENFLDDFIEKKDWLKKNYTKNTLRELRKAIFEIDQINYYLEKTQEIDKVLDIFIRTNSGGEPLSFSDLLMSITTANWGKLDAREEIEGIVKDVFNIGFKINKDFILKTCLVLFNDNIKFRIENFDYKSVTRYEQKWDKIKKSIETAFKLVKSFGFEDQTLRAKNAVIPIIYFIYYKRIYEQINKISYDKNDKELIRKWLILSLLKGVFGGQSDSVLTRLRTVIKKELSEKLSEIAELNRRLKLNDNNSKLFSEKERIFNELKKIQFPIKQIKKEFISDPNKNLNYDGEFIEKLLDTQKEDVNSYLILSLIYPKIDYINFHKDHLHPGSFFEDIAKNISKIPKNQNDFYKDKLNWNSVLNLQLLPGPHNLSKNASSLKNWVLENKINLNDQLIPDIDLDIRNFKAFIEERRKMLKKMLKKVFET